MNLHRTTGKPDWQAVKPADYNAFQKVAAATYGIVTPANIITFIGFGLVILGLVDILNQQYWLGLTLLAVGRLLDIVDGAVAQATGTKSPLGELLDASIDKFGTVFTIAVLYIGAVAEWWVITLVLLPQVIIPLLVFYKRSKGIKIHPTRIGKLSMVATWVAIIGFLVAKATQNSGYFIIDIVSYAFAVASFILGSYALWQYATGRDR